ncbi:MULTISPECIES: GNAT family N-acetyltransferase [Citrobacter]|uniref:Acetyltransferase (GNAT) family protein n=2 Tax=Citrobacter koseri TaxID=545 RepID=A0A078LDM2_CITKO|nr:MULTISPECIES: GNAT family N-acetyltransferase [Citrobacter]EKV5612769.1 GNAT family N-acetyltransferase [Citrobacter koseri]MBE0023903.1 GNAT family N-acetyltransferase [Citrobacter koseri]MBE0083033.1 GNAT family N-acetyltransferase [Citrobacter koseri]MBJ8808655.1 GNAT family N-acetyltransferase [Citrobacter koseri]MBJ8874042.1 GNAT family N-acetyltransferase [Citrobacter koseri]
MKPTSPFVFREITRDDIPAVQSFIIRHLNLYFNAGRALPTASDDVFDLRGNYLERERNQLFGVWNEQQQIIGTLAICQYDDRIEMLHGRYNLPETAEICRCYVDQHYRRQGIGSQLVSLAEQFCEQQHYKILYLHTHHFLPGGYQFWRRNLFNVFMDVGDEWQIVHMEKPCKYIVTSDNIDNIHCL